MFAIAFYSIFYRIEAQCDLVVHRWYAKNGMLVNKIDEVKQALDIITEQETTIKFILNTSK